MTIKNQFQPPKVGDSVTFRKTMTVAEQAMLTGISGNLGDLYVDRRAAASAGLADMAVFELAAASLLSTSLSRLAGPSYRIASFSIAYDRAICVGTTVEATAILSSVEGDSLVFALTLKVNGEAYSTGEAQMVPVKGS